ncbi:MAG: hypothetical protein ACP5OR_09425 [Candidatus Dormibacteria bacterium]
MALGHKAAIALGVAASAVDLLVGVLTLVFTGGFSGPAFIAAAFYDSLPMLIAGIGIISGLALLRRRPGSLPGSVVIIVAGLVPLAVLYDIARTIIVYGGEYIPFPLSLVYLLLIILPMVLSMVSGVTLSRKG